MLGNPLPYFPNPARPEKTLVLGMSSVSVQK